MDYFRYREWGRQFKMGLNIGKKCCFDNFYGLCNFELEIEGQYKIRFLIIIIKDVKKI